MWQWWRELGGQVDGKGVQSFRCVLLNVTRNDRTAFFEFVLANYRFHRAQHRKLPE